ncbi:MAG: ABC transporter substrate-binding protein [Planctomycetota bacterium]
MIAAPHGSVRRLLLAVLPVAVLVLATSGCGRERGPVETADEPAAKSTPSAAADFPREVRAPGGELVRVPTRPVRIVPANSAAADFVLALAERSRVSGMTPETVEYSRVASDLAPWGDVVRAGKHTAESLLASAPDLVVDADWQDVGTRRLLERAGVPVLTLPTATSLDALLADVRAVGAALGEDAAAEELVASIDARVAALRERGRALGGRVLFYANYGTGGSAAGDATTSDLLLDLAGLANAAEELRPLRVQPREAARARPRLDRRRRGGAGGRGERDDHAPPGRRPSSRRCARSARDHLVVLPRTLSTSSSARRGCRSIARRDGGEEREGQ